MELLGALINTAVVLGIVEIIKHYLPFIREKYPFLLPIMTLAIGPVVAEGQTWLSAQIGVPIDLGPIAAIFTGASAVMVNQAGKQWNKGPGSVEKCLIIFVMGLFVLSGCSSINKAQLKFDQENYTANKELAVGLMKTWSLNSGFIAGLGLTDPVKFPVQSTAELRAIINSPTAVMALIDLDEVVKKRNYWSDEDFDLGFFLGTRVRAGSQAVIQLVRDFFPNLMEYAPALFAL